jgi:hypothetical protein
MGYLWVHKYIDFQIGVNMWKNVDEFTQWYKDNGYPIRPPAEDPVYITDNTLSVIVFREDRFQVELYMLAPNWETPSHAHPGIEHRIIYLSGTISGSRNGVYINDSNSWAREVNKDGCSIIMGHHTDFVGDDFHTVKSGTLGGMVAITQHWEDGLKMSSQSVQYEGVPIGPTHSVKVNLNAAEA